jgi:hypothetical protein
VTGAVVVLFVVLLAIIPRLVGVYASRRGAARRMLVASLAVGAPKLAGGPGTCRSCGAPVVVEENQAVARCMYCGADNVMKLPPWFLAAKAKLAGSVAHTLEAALAVDAAERANTRDSTLRELRRYATWAAIFGGLFSLQQWDYAREAVHDHGEFPVAGALATVGIVVAIFVMIFRSGASKQEAAARAARNEDNDLSWLGFAGPIAFWGVLYVVGQAWSVLYLALHRS